VLFADVVAFTPLAERIEPEQVVAVLNELFTFLTEIVFRHGGMVDKFVGDCVMAVFGAPYQAGDDAVRAVRAAEEMLRWLDVGNARWTDALGTGIEIAIGVNTGEAVAGNIGSRKRMEYTVIGDAVNLAARLESIARPGQVLMSRATMEKVKQEFDCVHVATRRLPGRQEDTELWALAE
jgi:class 3 adenylate cyclase